MSRQRGLRRFRASERPVVFKRAEWPFIDGRLGDARPVANATGWFVYPEPLPPLTGRRYRRLPRAERAGYLRAAELYLTDRNIIARVVHSGREPEFLTAPFEQWDDMTFGRAHDCWRLWVAYRVPGDPYGAFLAFDFLRNEEASAFFAAIPKATYAGQNRSAEAPPGWHTDPTGRNDLRWWDGERWTSQVAAHNGSPTVDPNG